MITDIYPKTKNEAVGLQKVYGKITEILQRLNLIAPVSYKKYVALLTQSDTGVPDVIVLENTLSGVPIWSYDSVGIYYMTLVNEFALAKTYVLTGATDNTRSYVGYVGNVNTVYVEQSRNDGSYTPVNGLSHLTIEIRVYF
mgnify:CR=1 FL=1